MKVAIVFKEVTQKTIIIEGENLKEILKKEQEYLDNPSELIDFEKEPDYYNVFVDERKDIVNMKSYCVVYLSAAKMHNRYRCLAESKKEARTNCCKYMGCKNKDIVEVYEEN